MSTLEYAGSPDPQGERGGELAKQKTLDDIRERMGKEKYEGIIKKLAHGEIADLTPEEQAIITEIKERPNI